MKYDTQLDLLDPLELFMHAPAAICVLRGPEFVFTLANERYREIVGGRDLVGKTAREALPEFESSGLFELLERVWTTGESHVGNEIPVPLDRRGDGTLETVYFNFVYQPIMDPDGAPHSIFVHAVEVTEQAQAQQRLAAVLEQMPAGVMIVEAPSGRTLLSNARVGAMLGNPLLETSRLTEQAAYAAVHADGTPYSAAEYPLARAMASGVVVSDEDVRVVRADGSQGWLRVSATPIRDAAGEIVAGVVIFTDITDRRRAADDRRSLLAAERAARAEAERAVERTARLLDVTAALATAVTREEVAATALRAGIAATGAVAGGLGVLTPDGHHLDRLAMFGYPPEITDGTERLQTLDELGPIGETARSGQPIWLATNAEIFGRYPQLGSIPARRRYGAAVSVPLQLGGQTLGVMSLRYPDERPYNADDLGLIMAIGGQCAQALERARLFDAERAARAEAEDAVRARDEFLSIASHELRTPVAALKGTAQLLLRRMLRGEVDAERIERALHIIDETADRLTVLTADLLDVARLRSGRLTLNPQPLDLTALARDALEREREQRGDEYARAVTLDAPEQLPPVQADATRIDQVLANLLDNALKYSPDGQPVRVSVQPDGAGLRVSVSDAGIGLPPGAQESIFEPFGRAANAAASNLPGLGLGLYISRNIIEQHGGRIWAESPGEGLGTTFHVWLPGVAE